MRRALGRERPAVEEYAQRMACAARMLSWLNERLGRPLSRPELADLAQNAALAVWRKLDRFDGSAPLEAWVFRFCRLELLAHLRKRRRLPRLLADLGPDERPPLSTPAAEPFRYEAVHRGLDALSSDESAVVRLKHFAGLTFEEIGTRLGISPNTAKTRYYRSIERLREQLLPDRAQTLERER